MIDLKNKTVDDINTLIAKYSTVLEFIENRKRIVEYVVIFDISVNYIKNKYADINLNIKAWAVYVIKKILSNDELPLKYQLKNDNDIYKIIDEFVVFYNSGHSDYLETIDSYVSEFDRDLPFINEFIFKKFKFK